MPFNPRDYQSEAKDNLRTLFKSKVGDLPNLRMKGLSYEITDETDAEKPITSVMVVASPGAGKGDVLCDLAASHWRNGGRVKIWVHRTELCDDLGERLTKTHGVPANQIGYIMSGVPELRSRRIQIASVMTAVRRDTSWFSPTLVLTDECHRILTNTQMTLLDRVEGVRIVSFTATPFSARKEVSFVNVFDCLIQLATYMELMEKKFLMPPVVKYPKGAASLDGVKIRMGDYVQSDLEAVFMQERLYAGVYSKWIEYTGGKWQTMVFSVGQKHNMETMEFFKKKGISCCAIDDKTPPAERKRLVDKFKEGPFAKDPIMVLFSIAIFVEGFDNHWVKCVILNFATKSPTKLFQASPRGSRPVWNKDYSDWLKMPDGKYYKDKITIIDFGGNHARLGALELYDFFGFDLTGKKREGDAPMKVCKECRTMVFAAVMTCPHCGYVFPPDKKKDEKKFADEVDWSEINKDQMIVKKVIELKETIARRVPTEQLRIVALIKGYDKRWLFQRVEERGEWQQEGVEVWGNKPGTFEHYLEQVEKEKGTYTIYERLKSKRISI